MRGSMPGTGGDKDGAVRPDGRRAGADPAASAGQAARVARVDDRRVLNGIFRVLKDRIVLAGPARALRAAADASHNPFNRSGSGSASSRR